MHAWIVSMDAAAGPVYDKILQNGVFAKEMGSKNPEISFWWFKNFNVFLYFICNYNTWNKTQQCMQNPTTFISTILPAPVY